MRLKEILVLSVRPQADKCMAENKSIPEPLVSSPWTRSLCVRISSLTSGSFLKQSQPRPTLFLQCWYASLTSSFNHFRLAPLQASQLTSLFTHSTRSRLVYRKRARAYLLPLKMELTLATATLAATAPNRLRYAI